MKTRVETLAEYTYLHERKKNNITDWKDVSDVVRASYMKDAEDQISYVKDILAVIVMSNDDVIELKRTVEMRNAKIIELEKQKISLQKQLAIFNDVAFEDDGRTKNVVLDSVDGNVEYAMKKIDGKFPSGRDAKRAISALLGIDVVNMKAPLPHWIGIQIDKYGWDRVKRAIDNV